jgi:hypothetical protein
VPVFVFISIYLKESIPGIPGVYLSGVSNKRYRGDYYGFYERRRRGLVGKNDVQDASPSFTTQVYIYVVAIELALNCR